MTLQELLALAAENEKAQSKPSPMSFEEMQRQVAAAQAERDTPGVLGSIGVGALQGGTMGLADEMHGKGVEAGIRLEGAQPGYGRGAPPILQPGAFERGQAAGNEVRDADRRKLALAEAAHPIATTGGMIAGGLPIAAITGGAAAPASMLGRAAVTGLEGALQGGAQGYGMSTSDDPWEQMKEAGLGAAVGGVTGGAMAPVGHGVASVARVARNAVMPTVEGLSPAGQRVLDVMFRGRMASSESARRLAELGPDAMLADTSEGWRALARTGMGHPETADIVGGAFRERAAAAAPRIEEDLTKGLGPSPDLHSVRQGVRQTMKDMGPQYEEAFARAKSVDTSDLALRMEQLGIDKRGEGQAAAQRVRKMLNITGSDQLDPNPRTLQEIRTTLREELDDPKTPDAARGVLGEAKKMIDLELHERVPGIRELDANYAAKGRRMDVLGDDKANLYGNADDVMRGGDNSMSPNDVRRLVKKQIEPTGDLQGPSDVPNYQRKVLRAMVDRKLGNKENDAMELGAIFKDEGGWPQQKLDALIGEERGAQVRSAVDREGTFRRTQNRVTSGSDTAATAAMDKELEAINSRLRPSDLLPTSFTGAVLAGGKKALDAAAGPTIDNARKAMVGDLVRIATATGPERDRLIQALANRVSTRDLPPSAVIRSLVARGLLPANVAIGADASAP